MKNLLLAEKEDIRKRNDSMKFFSPGNRFKRIIRFLVFLIIGIAVGFGLGLLIGYCIKAIPVSFDWIDFAFVLLAFYVSVILHTALHELGHMFSALICGWKFISFMMFGFLLSFKDGRIHISRYKVPGAMGQCLMLPPDRGDTDSSVSFYNAGGVLMNLLFTLLAACLAFCCWRSLPYYLTLFLFPFSLTGLYMVLVNAIPMKVGGLPNDGMNIVNLRKDKISTSFFLFSMKAVGAMQNSVRISDIIDRYITDDIVLDYSNPIHVMAVNFDYFRALDLMDFDKAAELMSGIDAHSTVIPGIYKLDFSMEKIFLILIKSDSYGEIDSLLDKDLRLYIDKVASLRPCGLRVRYALALLYERDMAKAENIYNQFEVLCSKYYLPGEVIMERMLVEKAGKAL